jgi:urease accessory protein
MITVNSIIGNIKKDKILRQKFDKMSAENSCETITIHRSESQRVRMRKTSDKGTDIALTLPQGTQLRQGDVIALAQDKMVIVDIEPESVAVIAVRNNLDGQEIVEVPVRVGHTIGNLHRPIRLEGNKIFFPIQADTELDMFKKLFAPITEHLEITKTQMVFEPQEGTEIHEH